MHSPAAAAAAPSRTRSSLTAALHGLRPTTTTLSSWGDILIAAAPRRWRRGLTRPGLTRPYAGRVALNAETRQEVGN